jgi:hypothetical protein
MGLVSPGCANDTAGALADGLHQANDCFDPPKSPRLFVALVANPNVDYHWYRLHSEGFWGHKPGQDPATNVDDAGLIVTNPETCVRVGYPDFCGYFIVPSDIVVSGPGASMEMAAVAR